MSEDKNTLEISPEQDFYASLLMRGAWTGIGILMVSFAIYLSGLISPHVPIDQLPSYWSMQSEEYVQAAGVPSGWGWVSLVGRADFMNFVGIALLGLLTMGCLFTLISAYARKRDWIYLAIVFVQILVLGASASGLLTGLG